MDYNQTLNLPKTDFPMRANLPQREPEILAAWLKNDMYGKLMEHNSEKPLFVLHDGPPFANGDLHTGHMLNKTLKDVIARYKNISGYKAPYVHGWDTHGLPIETQAIKKLKLNRNEVSTVEFRNICRDFALSYVENQKGQLQRLGSLGEWDNPYITLQPEFEAEQIKVFGEMAKKGLIYKGMKPVYWCPDCETALAEAEIEYEEDKTTSIYVKFKVKDSKDAFLGLDNVYFVIWTTTTWTLPGNLAISLNPNFEYCLTKVENEYYILAKELIEATLKAAGKDKYDIVKTFKGKELEGITCFHPFLDRESLVIVGDHVTLEAGTGCVHTAPGHGMEDYLVCLNYPNIPIVVPVDDNGCLNSEAGQFAGMYYAKANAAIIEQLKSTNSLLASEDIIHQYPHCWRCHEPIIYRATEQWFCSIESFKADAIKAIGDVAWFPAWGEERIKSMVADRGDWCISRQRKWGVPIPMFYCTDCGKELINDETINAVSDLFRKEGSTSWYAYDASDILPKGTKCTCGCDTFTKETDIMDVWFDSGSSHAAVLAQRKDLHWPADLYLEGHDQYRGWFQSSLLTAVATKGRAPYKGVITHGFVVDGKGEKMSKSKGNGINPMDLINEYGADVVRLWAISADYKSDVRISKDILKQLSEVYRKIRNTSRYILGNIYDFSPDTDAVPYEKLNELDRWALIKLNRMIEKVISAYESYEFYLIYHAIHNFCVVNMSNFYLDVIKDRLYTEQADGLARRSAQTVMFEVLDALVRLITPILAYTSEEIWQFMPHRKGDSLEGALFNEIPKPCESFYNKELEEKWDKMLLIKDDVSKALEIARAKKEIGTSLAANVEIFTNDETAAFLQGFDMETIFIVSGVKLSVSKPSENAFVGEQIAVLVSAAEGEKCERCWKYSASVGTHHEHSTLCTRCAGVVE